MGMDYCYAGSASYPRFDRELQAVAEILGGKPTPYLLSLQNGISKSDWVTQMFGTISADQGVVNEKFKFPDGTCPSIIKFFNDPYGKFTVSETQEIWEVIKKHSDIEDVSSQIWYELSELVEYGEAWEIY